MWDNLSFCAVVRLVVFGNMGTKSLCAAVLILLVKVASLPFFLEERGGVCR